MRKKVVILGASGRDFHNFNVVFRDNEDYQVVAFVQTQIPGVKPRVYPRELAGRLYPHGIPIVGMGYFEKIVREWGVDEVVLSYSDLTFQELGEVLSRALATGASFRILGPRETMLESIRPVIAVTGVKTGAGKSSVSREIAMALKNRGLRVGIVRHPMPYGEEFYPVQVFESESDFEKYRVTVEEREEYEHYVKMGFAVFAGVDYGAVLREVERRSDVVLWDGGNNDWPFFRPDKMVVVADAMRPGLEVSTYPGMVNFMMADFIVINKADQAPRSSVESIIDRARRLNPRARVSVAASEVELEGRLEGAKRVVVVEDAPTVTHGGAPYAAGYAAAKKYGLEVVDPRPYARGPIKEAYEKYPHMGPVVPSLGYSREQLAALEETLSAVPADAVVLGTPSDITRLIKLNKPVLRAKFRVKVVEGPSLEEIVDEFLKAASGKSVFA